MCSDNNIENTSEEILTKFNLSDIDKLILLKQLKGISFMDMSKAISKQLESIDSYPSESLLKLVYTRRHEPNNKLKEAIAQYFGVNVFELWKDEEKRE